MFPPPGKLCIVRSYEDKIMATITVQEITRTGLEMTTEGCVGGGDEFVNVDGAFVFIKNASGADKTVRFTIQKLVDGEIPPKKSVVVTLAEERRIGPFPTDIYNDADGKVQITYTAVTDLTIAVMKV